MIETTKLSAKGQVVIPADVRQALGLRAGQTLRVTRSGSGVLLTPVHQKTGRTTEELLAELGKLHKHDGPAATLADMDQAVSRMFAERGRRGEF